MGLYKRKNKDGSTTWYAQYFAHGKRIREAVGPSKRQADLVLGKRKAAIREGKFFDIKTESNITFGMLCDRYLKEYAALHKKPRSYLRNVASTKVLKAFFGEDTLAKAIQPADVHRFIAARKEEGKSNATINGEIAHLSHLFTRGVRMKLVAQHPVTGTPQLKANQKDRYLTHEEIQRLLAACEGDLKDMVVIALGTSMRASEVLGLDREQVDLRNAVIRLKDSKNGDRRVIPLPIQVVETFQHRPAPLRDYFPDWRYAMLKNRVSRCMRALGLSDVSFHTLRHTFASHAVMAGVDLYTLAKLLGHRDITIVQRYAHLAPDHLKAAVRLTATAIFAADMPHPLPHPEHVSA